MTLQQTDYLITMSERMEAWANFLELRDSIHLIVDIGVAPRRYSELEQRVSIGQSTLTERLNSGVKLGIWRKDIIDVEDGEDTEVYRLTDDGKVAFEQLEKLDAVEASQQARDHHEVVVEARQTLVDRLQNPGDANE